MLTVDRKNLTLLNPVRVDRSLAKYKDVDLEKDVVMAKFINSNLNDSFNRHGDLWYNNMSANTWDGVPFAMKRRFNKKWKKAIAELYIKTRVMFHNAFTKDKLKEEEFFNVIKTSFKELEDKDPNEQKLIKEHLEELYLAKQKWAFKKLKADYSVTESEKVLKENGIIKYQEEQDIVNFVLKSEAGISLIEIEYFQYDIPKEVKEKLYNADQLKIFDNFYILHKDKNYKPKEQELTKVEKDPILFGVINGSSKLYYIADWITDYCDLTYDYLIKQGNPERTL